MLIFARNQDNRLHSSTSSIDMKLTKHGNLSLHTWELLRDRDLIGNISLSNTRLAYQEIVSDGTCSDSMEIMEHDAYILYTLDNCMRGGDLMGFHTVIGYQFSL